MGFQDYYNKEQAGIDEGKQQADTKTTGVKSPGQQDVLFFLDPPKWAREGATKFTNWLKKTSLKGNEMEKSLSKMMITANIKSKDAVTELDKDLDRQVKVIKKVRGVSGMEYNSEKTRLGWTDKEPTIWLLLTFEGKMKTYLLSDLLLIFLLMVDQKGFIRSKSVPVLMLT